MLFRISNQAGAERYLCAYVIKKACGYPLARQGTVTREIPKHNIAEETGIAGCR
jgi:predicted Na+-dependent transporter